MYVQQLQWFVQLINMVTLIRRKKNYLQAYQKRIAFSQQKFMGMRNWLIIGKLI